MHWAGRFQGKYCWEPPHRVLMGFCFCNIYIVYLRPVTIGQLLVNQNLDPPFQHPNLRVPAMQRTERSAVLRHDTELWRTAGVNTPFLCDPPLENEPVPIPPAPVWHFGGEH